LEIKEDPTAKNARVTARNRLFFIGKLNLNGFQFLHSLFFLGREKTGNNL
jgi:hypothetical protein